MNIELGLLLRRQRLMLGMLQKDVAARVGVARPMVARWERGEAQPNQTRLELLAGALALPLEQLQALRLERRSSERAIGIPRRRRRVRGVYPIGATLDQMISFDSNAAAMHREVRERVGENECQKILDTYPRDTAPELMFVFHVMRRRGSKLVEHAPDTRCCPLLILDDYERKPGGDLRQPALLWRGHDEQMLIYGQVRVVGGKCPHYRVDFLVYYKRKGRPGQWLFVELDGSQHKWTPNQDAERAASIGIPQIRYDNQKVRSRRFFEQFVVDVREKADMAAAWSRRRARIARQERRQREQQAAQMRNAG